MARISFGATSQTTPEWMADFGSRDHLVPGGIRLNPAAFFDVDPVTVTVAAAAVAGATSITVNALSGPIAAGTVLDFGGDEFARVNTAAAAGATTLAVDPLPQALEGGETATVPGTAAGPVPSGTPIGRTFAERDAGAAFGPGADTDDEFFLLAFDVTDVAVNAYGVAYRPGSVVKENYLPGWADMSAALRAKIRDVYVTQTGAE